MSDSHPPDYGLLERADLHASLSDPMMRSMDFLNEISDRHPAAISFASGRPYEGFFEIGHIGEYLEHYIGHLRATDHADEAIRRKLFQYGPTNGLIRPAIARMLEVDEGIQVSPRAIMVTAGCQEAMLIALRGLHRHPGDTVLTPSPCYLGLAGAARLLDIPLAWVEESATGLDAAELARVAQRVRKSGDRPVACYVTPDFANPSGVSLSLPDRRRLLDVAESEDLLLLEDNPYGLLGDERSRLPTLKALDSSGRVIYLGTFAKSAFPGARIGYLVADQGVSGTEHRYLAEELSVIKSMVSVSTSAIGQGLIGGLLLSSDHGLRAAQRSRSDFYLNNLRVLSQELARHFPPDRRQDHGVHWKRPDGGFFLVVHIPFPAGLELLERSAADYGVLWTPMSFFYLDGGSQAVRLSFSGLTPELVAAGARRFAAFVSDVAQEQAVRGGRASDS